MRCAAFFRNVNLGRPNAPTRAQLEAAFLEAGAASATSFLVNGTLVFDVPPHARPRALASRACVLMRASCGLREPVFVRRVDELAALVASRPFDLHDDPARCAPHPRGAHAGSLRSGRALAGADDPARRASAAGSVDDDLCCVSFLAGHRPALPAFPLTSARGDIDFVATTGAEVFSVARVVGKSAGSPNAWLERTLGAAATTRNWRTVVRLVEKFS